MPFLSGLIAYAVIRKAFAALAVSAVAASGAAAAPTNVPNSAPHAVRTMISLATFERHEQFVREASGEFSAEGSALGAPREVVMVTSLGEREYDVAILSSRAPGVVYTGTQATVTLSHETNAGGGSANTPSLVMTVEDADPQGTPSGGGNSSSSEERAGEEGGEGIWEYASGLKRDLNYYAQVIARLRENIRRFLERLEDVESLTQSKRHGAGNIEFIHKDDDGAVFVLKTNGTVWRSTSSGWFPAATAGIDVPIPASDIVMWQLTTFLDENGDVWRFDAGAWTNFGHP